MPLQMLPIPRITYKRLLMTMHDLPRARCWLEVSMDALTHNLNVARSLLRPGTELIAVLKADAYGLGIKPVGQLLRKNGVTRFAVACLEEAFELRSALPDAWILCMGETLGGAIKEAVGTEIRLTVGSLDSAKRIAQAARACGKKAFVHCKVDTGLHRIGFWHEEAALSLRQCAEMPGLEMEGVYTHLALHDRESDIAQHEALQAVLQECRLQPEMVHMLDSIGLTRYPDWQYNAVRVGAMLYGNSPRGFDRMDEIQPTVRFAARVARVSWVKAGECIGYDDGHPLERDTRVATLTAGYADGYPRALSYVGAVEINGQRAKNIGLICMDQMMVDVTEIDDVQPGQEAVLLGGGISLTEYAAQGHLNRNECTAVIGKRVPRIYL